MDDAERQRARMRPRNAEYPVARAAQRRIDAKNDLVLRAVGLDAAFQEWLSDTPGAAKPFLDLLELFERETHGGMLPKRGSGCRGRRGVLLPEDHRPLISASLARAAPVSMSSAAVSQPSEIEPARPATSNAAPALSRTASRLGPRSSPLKMRRT